MHILKRILRTLTFGTLAIILLFEEALGITLLLGAKVLGAAIVARLFQLTQPALMRFELFAQW